MINRIWGEENWLDSALMCPLANIELLIDIAVIGNYKYREKKLHTTGHMLFLASGHNIMFEEEPVKMWLLFTSSV